MDSKTSDQELVGIIADFLEMGHLENILTMFRRDPSHYRLSGELLRDERFRVRLGMAVLFEQLAEQQPAEVAQAVPFLLPLLADESPLLRGEAAGLLASIGTPEALAALQPLRDDPDPQVAEVVGDILAKYC
ncbi:MAG: HEAT repeat domain-containing protein [Desulfurivibrio sp.]|nr:HEAT repeat domain-containing protein [Desulfurivibrio sp.]